MGNFWKSKFRGFFGAIFGTPMCVTIFSKVDFRPLDMSKCRYVGHFSVTQSSSFGSFSSTVWENIRLEIFHTPGGANWSLWAEKEGGARIMEEKWEGCWRMGGVAGKGR